MRIPRALAYLSVLVATITTMVLSAALKDAPSKPTNGTLNKVWVQGTIVTAHFNRVRYGAPCNGAYATRRMVTFWDEEHINVKNFQFIIETQLVDPNLGELNAWATFHLYSPLDPMAGEWFLLTEVHDNCPLWYRTLPFAISKWFVERPSLGRFTMVEFNEPPKH